MTEYDRDRADEYLLAFSAVDPRLSMPGGRRVLGIDGDPGSGLHAALEAGYVRRDDVNGVALTGAGQDRLAELRAVEPPEGIPGVPPGADLSGELPPEDMNWG